MAKKIVFYNYPTNTDKICFTITEKSVNDLVEENVIPKDSKYVIEDFDENNKSTEYLAKLSHVDKLVFDDYVNPTKVEFDFDLLGFYFVQIYREIRSNVFVILDNLQIRALIKNKNDVVSLIEEDKQKLRDMPDNLNYSKCSKVSDVFRIVPEELLIDYKEKYEYMIESK